MKERKPSKWVEAPKKKYLKMFDIEESLAKEFGENEFEKNSVNFGRRMCKHP